MGKKKKDVDPGPIKGAEKGAAALAKSMLVFEEDAETSTESYLDIGSSKGGSLSNHPPAQAASPGGMRRRISGPVGKVFQVRCKYI